MLTRAKSVQRYPISDLKVRVTVTHRNGQHGVVGSEPVDADRPLLELAGVLTATPSRYSVQVGLNLHLMPPADLSRDDFSEPYRWRFINHSCDPNAAFRGRILVSLRPIAQDEEVTFDYNTTEYDMASPFVCNCGHCGGRKIGGFRHLSIAERQCRADILADHLRPLIDAVAE